MADPALESISDEETAPDDAPQSKAEVKAEAKAEKAIADAADLLVPMTHPDGGKCDAYKTDKAGNHLVPLADVPTMADHGFAIVNA